MSHTIPFMTFRRFSNWLTIVLGLVFGGLVFTYWGDPPEADASRYIDHRPIRPRRPPLNKVAGPKPQTSKEVAPVNINQATMAELMTLKGIGESKAKRILAFRQRHGSFKRIKDLRRVKGIGRKTVMKLRPYLSLSSPLANTPPTKARIDDKKPPKQ